MGTLFGKKRHEKLEAGFLAEFERILAEEGKLDEATVKADTMHEIANATINGKTAINRKTGQKYTAVEVKRARAATRALKIAKGQEGQLPEVDWSKGYGVTKEFTQDVVEGGNADDRSGGTNAAAAGAPSTEGMARATSTKPALPLDAALQKAISGLAPGAAVGPTRKAAKVQGKRKKLEKISTPTPGSIEWLLQREREEEAAREQEVRKRRMEAGLKNPISGGKTPSVEGGSFGFPSIPDTAPPRPVDKSRSYLGTVQSQGQALKLSQDVAEVERLAAKYGTSFSPSGRVVPKPRPKKNKDLSGKKKKGQKNYGGR